MGGKVMTKIVVAILFAALSSCALESAEDDDNSDEETATEQAVTSQCVAEALRPGLGPNISDPIPANPPNPLYFVPISGGGSTACFLAQGDNSSAVLALQNAMRTCYFQGITVDGDFGPNTKQALINVQHQLGIKADGVYGVQTRASMKFT